MSTPATTAHPEQRVADAARVVERHHLGRLPVVDEEDRLIGVATRRDLLRVFLRTDPTSTTTFTALMEIMRTAYHGPTNTPSA